MSTAAAQPDHVFKAGFELRGPEVTITAPDDGASFQTGETISFAGRAFDREDKHLSSSLSWASSIDGPIGSGDAFDLADLSAGTHLITARATDRDGNDGSDQISLTVISTAANITPSVTIGSPADGAAFTEGEAITFSGSASDREDGDLSASLAWTSSLDGAIGSGASFSHAGLSVGTHTVTARVTDSDGSSASARVSLTVSAPGNAPSVTITAPADGASFTAGEAVSFSGNATDTEDKNLKRKLSWTSSIDGEIGSGASFTHDGLSVGTHTITASVTDSDGNTGTARISVTIGGANEVPSVTISGPASGSSFEEGQAISFSGSATDTEDGNLSASLSWESSLDGVIGSGASFSHAGLSVGTHTITASVTDSGGNTGTAGISVTVSGANQAPSVTISGPASGSSFEEGQPISFSGSASDEEDGNLSASLSWKSSLDGVIGSGASFSHAGLSVGTHTITASVTDSGGNTGTAGISVTVSNANQAPSVTISAPASGSSFDEGEAISFSGSASDEEDGNLSASLSWKSSLDGVIGSGASFSHAGLSVGTHTITASVTDNDGAGDSARISLTVNAVDTAPSVTITGPASGSSFSEGESIHFTGKAADDQDGDLSNNLSWTSDLDGPIGSGAAFDHFALSAGTHTITAGVTDADGNNGSDQITVRISDGTPDGELVLSIAADADDAEESPDGAVSLGSSDLELGLLGDSENEIVGLRFNNVAIPQGSTIVSAYVQFTTDEVDSDPVELLIEGQASGHARAFDLADYNISDRPRTLTNKVWMPSEWPVLGESGLRQRTPELAEIINEIVDRSDWSSGNSLALLISGDGRRVAQSFDKDPNAAARLYVSYNDPGSNRRPVVDAGADQVLGVPGDDSLQLNGSVSDDLLPAGEPLVTLWSHVGGTGSGTVTFADPFALDTTVSIAPEVGTYILRLTADDGELASSDELEVLVTSNTGAAGAGTVKIHMKIYSSTNDRLFDDPLTAEQKAEMASMYHQLTAFSPSFDEHLSWFPGAWDYQNLYGLNADEVTPGHPLWEYVLKDANGNPLYIDYACSPTCPQLAADFGDPGFRSYWIDDERSIMEKGYAGIMVDDIDLREFNISDEYGNQVIPFDERTGKEMTLGDLQTYKAEFAEAIRAAFPDKEIVHNAIFAAEPADNPGPGEMSAIDRQLWAADLIKIETGFPVVEGGFHHWGFETFLAFVDKWHARGKRFVLYDDDSVEDDDGELPAINADELRELRYQLAAYYLINNGSVSMSADGDAQKYRVHPSFYAPDAFSPDYQHDLGDALTGHYKWKGLFRRDFACGIVLVNQPEQSTITVELGESYTNLDGQVVTSVTLPTVSGAVLRKPCAS